MCTKIGFLIREVGKDWKFFFFELRMACYLILSVLLKWVNFFNYEEFSCCALVLELIKVLDARFYLWGEFGC